MLIDCINFNRLILGASNAYENRTRDHLTTIREAFLAYDLSDNSLCFLDFEKKTESKKQIPLPTASINAPSSEEESKKKKRGKKQVALTKAALSPQSCKVLKNLYNNYCKSGKEDELTADELFNEYVESVIQRLNEIGINFENYFKSLMNYASSVRSKPDEYKVLQCIASSKSVTEADIKQFMTLMIATSIKNLYRSDEALVKELYDIQLGMNLTNKLRIPYLELCAELGDRNATYDLAMIYYHGIDDVPEDPIRCYEYCIASDSAPGIWTVGWLFQQGLIRKTKNRNKQPDGNEIIAVEENEKSSNKKKMAEVVKTSSIKPNYRESIRYYLKCTKGRLTYAKAFNSLGNLSILALKEPEVPFSLIQVQDMNELDTAEYYFTKALELGDCHAAENMGNLCLRKANTLEDGKEKTALLLRAFSYFSIGKEYEMANCINRIGEFYLYGYCDKIPTDIQNAENQFRKAIQLGSGWAKYNLAKLLLEEKTLIAPDKEIRSEAIQLLKEAAGHDKNPKAQELLKKLL